MKEVVIATKNRHKVREIQEIFSELPIQFVSLLEFKNAPTITEDGHSFEENAAKKALGIAQWTGKVCLADDSGIEVDYLNGAPGIYSARFSGEDATDEENNEKLLNLLANVPLEKRSARYRCVMALASPQKIVKTESGICEGLIALKPEGTQGFGYDPLFFYPPMNKTFGRVEAKLKNKISHRYHALEKIKPALIELMLHPHAKAGKP